MKEEEVRVKFSANYLFSFNDFQMMSKAVNSRKSYRSWVLIGLIAFMLLISFSDIFTSKNAVNKFLHNPLEIFLGVFPVFFMLLILAVASRLSLIERLAYKRRCAFAEKNVSYIVGAEGVTWATDDASGTLKWSEISSTVMAPDGIVLIVHKYSGVFLPKRAFASSNDFQSAVNYMKSHVSA